jgi:hypothetical protein
VASDQWFSERRPARGENRVKEDLTPRSKDAKKGRQFGPGGEKDNAKYNLGLGKNFHRLSISYFSLFRVKGPGWRRFLEVKRSQSGPSCGGT